MPKGDSSKKGGSMQVALMLFFAGIAIGLAAGICLGHESARWRSLFERSAYNRDGFEEYHDYGI